MQKPGREQSPIFTTESKRAAICAQRPEIDARKKIHDVNNDADGHQQRRSRICRQTSHRHGSASATGGNARATVAQNWRDSFFIYSKGCTAFQAVRHSANRITRKLIFVIWSSVQCFLALKTSDLVATGAFLDTKSSETKKGFLVQSVSS